MIEFVLLFALGFLAAVLLVLIAAPVVHRRVVRFAEDRLKDTMPLSVQEVRAQKDAARAGYAAETARATLKLKSERDKTVQLMVDNEQLMRQHRSVAEENAELTAQMGDMNVEAADLRSTCRQLEGHIDRLKTALQTVERDNENKSSEIKLLVRQLDSLSGEINSLKEQIGERDRNIEMLRERTAELRTEREALRTEARDTATLARELEGRLAREETRIRQFEDSLEKQMTMNADKDTALERRNAEIERLKTRLKDSNGAATAPRGPGTDLRGRRGKRTAAAEMTAKDIDGADVSQLTDMARSRAAALTLPLNGPISDSEDARIRDEIAGIAATMVTLTAAREGATSPIPSLLAKMKDTPAPENAARSLAERIRGQIERRS